MISGNEYALYIHIPYCERRCYFCSIPVAKFTSSDVIDGYLTELIYEMKIKRQYLKNSILKGIHIGGGTPSVLSALQVKRLMDAIGDLFGEEIPEIVFEANPTSMHKDKVDVLAGYRHVTLNFGIQTFQPHRLRGINRMDDVEAIKECLQYAVGKKELYVGIDLIVGLPDSQVGNFDEDIKTVEELGIKNVFVYPYRLEDGSFFYNHRNGRKYLLQNELIRNVEYAEEKMRGSGYKARTIYYWTREDVPLYFYASHQIDGKEWIGVGAGAYSYLNGMVIRNNLIEQNNQKWFSGSGEKHALVKKGISGMAWDLAFMIKREHFDTGKIIQKYGEIAEPYLKGIIKKLDENGYIQRRDNEVCLSAKGKVLIGNVERIIQEIILK